MRFPFLRVCRVAGGWAFVYDIADGDGEPLRVLRIGGAFQSAAYYGERRWELPFEYMRAFDAVFEASECGGAHSDGTDGFDGFRIRNILMIGGGACSWPKHVMATRSDVSVDVVERDPKVAQIARRLFFVDELEEMHREDELFRLIVGDGLSHLSDTAKTYDVIVNDAFNGADFDADLLMPDALALSKARLTPNGLYAINVVSEPTPEGADWLCHVLDSLKSCFAHVYIIPATDEDFSDFDNYILIASDASYRFRDSIEFE